MGIFRQFPYSNFHEMNMDEIIKIIKNMLEEWAQYHAEWDQWMADLEASWAEYKDDVNAQWAAYQNTMNTAWQSMQNFINNYFDNLDVQEEINNKIVSMIQSGEFGLLVNEYIPPAVNAWLNLNITQPTGVVIDKSLTVAGACADAKATGDAIGVLSYTLTDDIFIDSTGSTSVNTYYCATSFIPTTLGLKVKTYMDNDSSRIAFYDSDHVFISAINIYEDSGNLITLNIPSAASYVRISCLKENKNDFIVRFTSANDNIEKLISYKKWLDMLSSDSIDISNSINYIEGYFIRPSGVITSLNVYSYSELIKLNKGDKITIYANGGTPNSVSMLSEWSCNGTQFIGNLYTCTLADYETIEYTATNDTEYLRICYYHGTGGARLPIPVVSIKYTNYETVKNKAFNNEVESYDFSYAMDKILCIGDSLTSGANFTGSWRGASIDQNYPRILGRMLCGETTNAGFSGYSASDWYNNKINVYNFSDYDTIIIWLGTNNGLTDTLDTDVNPYTDYHDFANTETGYYCKIIEAIKAQNANCLIVLTKIFASQDDVTTTNTVIEKIALKYSLPVVDNSDLGVSRRMDLHGNVSNPHFSKAGNLFVASRYMQKIGKWISMNLTRADFGETARTN